MSAVTAQLDTLIVVLAAIGLLAAASAVFHRVGRRQERARHLKLVDAVAELAPTEFSRGHETDHGHACPACHKSDIDGPIQHDPDCVVTQARMLRAAP